MRLVEPSPEVIAYIDDLKAVITKHKHLNGAEMLAGCAQLLGQLIAFQDRRKHTLAEVMEVVSANLEQGNQDALLQTYEGQPQ